MKIDSLRLENFRNYKSLELDFSSGSNLFYGDNAQGKTNILEAVYFCGTTRSHRTSRDRDLICFGQEEAHLRMELVSRGQPYRIDVHLKNGRAKGIHPDPPGAGTGWTWKFYLLFPGGSFDHQEWSLRAETFS